MSEIKEEDFTKFKQKNMYRSCCSGSTDKRLIILISQLVVSFTLIIFSAFMLAENSCECECSGSEYQNLLFSIVSFWLGRKSDNQ